MGARIATLQRQARELGRLRTGTYDPTKGNGKGAPQRSKTWIFTSASREQVEAAAALWGGKAEQWQPQGNGDPQWRTITERSSIDAILPQGDPLSSEYETWSAGGSQLVCNGVMEKLSGNPCVCRAKFGETFWETGPKEYTCKITTRLGVILPDMPDLGWYRVETHSYYATQFMVDAIDTIRAAVGPMRLVPLTLTIEPRTKVSKGKTKRFPVIVVSLRGATAGQLLAATMDNGGELGTSYRLAIEAPRPDYVGMAKDATTLDEVRAIWTAAKNAGHMTDALNAQLMPIGDALKDAAGPVPATGGAVAASGQQDDGDEEIVDAHLHEDEFDSDCAACKKEQAEADRSIAGGAR
jgi:hypothetical protein